MPLFFHPFIHYRSPQSWYYRRRYRHTQAPPIARFTPWEIAVAASAVVISRTWREQQKRVSSRCTILPDCAQLRKAMRPASRTGWDERSSPHKTVTPAADCPARRTVMFRFCAPSPGGRQRGRRGRRGRNARGRDAAPDEPHGVVPAGGAGVGFVGCGLWVARCGLCVGIRPRPGRSRQWGGGWRGRSPRARRRRR